MSISTYLREQLQNGEISINQARKFIGHGEINLGGPFQERIGRYQWFLFLSSMLSADSIGKLEEIFLAPNSKISSLDQNTLRVAKSEGLYLHTCKMELVATEVDEPKYDVSISFQKIYAGVEESVSL